MSFVATPTKSVVETVARALQLVQKTNSWTQGTDLEQEKDSQGKTRSAFCLRGALRAAVTGETEKAQGGGRTTRQENLVRAASNAIVRTINKNLKRYGLEEKTDSVMDFNDGDIKHRHVLRALRDTVSDLRAKSFRQSVSNSICGE